MRRPRPGSTVGALAPGCWGSAAGPTCCHWLRLGLGAALGPWGCAVSAVGQVCWLRPCAAAFWQGVGRYLLYLAVVFFSLREGNEGHQSTLAFHTGRPSRFPGFGQGCVWLALNPGGGIGWSHSSLVQSGAMCEVGLVPTAFIEYPAAISYLLTRGISIWAELWKSALALNKGTFSRMQMG